MSSRPNRAIVLRWIFLLIGLFLLLGGGSVIGFYALAPQLAAILSRGDDFQQRFLIGLLNGIPLTAGAVCVITSWGIAGGRPWSRLTGMWASLLVILLLCPLSLAGFWCMWALARPLELPAQRKPEQPGSQSKDYWLAARKSPTRGVVTVILGLMALAAISGVRLYAGSRGLTGWDPGYLAVPLLLLVDIAVHEVGHVTMAWALHNSVRAIEIGPFALRDAGYGFEFHFDWTRPFGSGGSVTSAPQSAENLRWNFVAEVAGGPAAALLGALVSLAIFLSLPGSSWQACWWIPGYLSVIFLFDAVHNSIPLGYCDGNMLYHLIRWTPEGQLLLGRKSLAQVREQEKALNGRAEFDKVVEIRQRALEEAMAGGERNAYAIACCHERLGYAYCSLHDWPSAEEQLRKCLTFEAECAADGALPVNAWSALQRVFFERHHAAEAGTAYAKTVAALEQQQKNRDRVSTAVAGAMLSRAHFYAGAFDKALAEADTAIRILPAGRSRLLLRVEAAILQARAQFALGSTALARIRAAEAAEMLRSPEIPVEKRNSAWNDLAEFASALWIAGEADMAVELLRDAIEGLLTGGAVVAAAGHRIDLAGILRQLGREVEAWQCLPDQAGLPDCTKRGLLEERTRLYLAAGQPAQAITECGWLLLLWRSEPVESARAQSLLAQACLDSGDHHRAAEFAHQAAEVLGPWGHCEMAACLITTALAQWNSDKVWLPAYVERARAAIAADSLLQAGQKQRLWEAQAKRVERCSVPTAREIGETHLATDEHR